MGTELGEAFTRMCHTCLWQFALCCQHPAPDLSEFSKKVTGVCWYFQTVLDYITSLLKALQGPCTFQKLPKL